LIVGDSIIPHSRRPAVNTKSHRRCSLLAEQVKAGKVRGTRGRKRGSLAPRPHPLAPTFLPQSAKKSCTSLPVLPIIPKLQTTLFQQPHETRGFWRSVAADTCDCIARKVSGLVLQQICNWRCAPRGIGMTIRRNAWAQSWLRHGLLPTEITLPTSNFRRPIRATMRSIFRLRPSARVAEVRNLRLCVEWRNKHGTEALCYIRLLGLSDFFWGTVSVGGALRNRSFGNGPWPGVRFGRCTVTPADRSYRSVRTRLDRPCESPGRTTKVEWELWHAKILCSTCGRF